MSVIDDTLAHYDKLINNYIAKLQSGARALKDPKEHKLVALNKIQNAAFGLNMFISDYRAVEQLKRDMEKENTA